MFGEQTLSLKKPNGMLLPAALVNDRPPSDSASVIAIRILFVSSAYRIAMNSLTDL